MAGHANACRCIRDSLLEPGSRWSVVDLRRECGAQSDMRGAVVQECRAKAAEEMTQARRRLEASAAEEDALRQRAQQQAADIASQNNAIKDLQSEVCRASLNAKVRLSCAQPGDV